MSDTEILDRVQEYGIQVWPHMVKMYKDAPRKIDTWNTFVADPKHPGDPVQVSRVFLRPALVDTIEELEKR